VLLGARISQKSGGVMISERDALKVVRELFRIGVGFELAFADGAGYDCGNDLQPVTLESHQSVACETVLIVQFE
jgi:hypothetical protein